MTLKMRHGAQISVGGVDEVTFRSEDGVSHTLRLGESADIVHNGQHMRVLFTPAGIMVQEISGDELRHIQKQEELKKTAAAVAKVMGWNP